MIELADRVDLSELKSKGLQIIRSFFPEEVKRDLAARAREIIALRDAGKLTTFDQDSKGLPDDWFKPLLRNDSVVRLMTQALGPDVCTAGMRVLAKDKHFKMSVHIHQDWPYAPGDTVSMTVFIPLTRMNKANGGLVFIEESHQYGPVSRGALDPSLFPPMNEVCPDVDVGDIIVCNFLTWHYSDNSLNGEERILLQFNYQPADDASSVDVVAGKRSHDKLLRSRFDAASTPSVELNCKTARKLLDRGEVDRATRWTRGLLYDDEDHAGAALLMCDILTRANDPNALVYLEQARSAVKKLVNEIAAFDRRYGIHAEPIVADAAEDDAQAAAWRSLDLTFHSELPDQADISALPAMVATSDQAWGYGAVSKPIQISGPSTIRIKARAAKGRIGFCLIRATDGELASEQQSITPEFGDAAVMIAAAPEHRWVSLVVRNFGDPSGSGEVHIQSVDILSLS